MRRWSSAAWTSARPSRRRTCCARAPHHLIDPIDPAESYSAARFVADAGAATAGIAARGRHPAVRRRHDALLPRLAVGARAAAGGRCGRARADRSARGRGGLAGSARRTRGARPRGGAPHPAGRPPAHPARPRGDRAVRPSDLGAAAAGPARRRAGGGPADRAGARRPRGALRTPRAPLPRDDAPGPAGGSRSGCGRAATWTRRSRRCA